MTTATQSTAELARAYVAGGPDAAQVLADDVVLKHPWGEFHGRDAVAVVADELAEGFPDREVEVTDVFADGSRAVARTVWRGTHTGTFRGAAPTGKTVEVVTYYHVEVRGGRVASIVAVTDSLGVFQQLGLLPRAKTVPPPLAYGGLLLQKLRRDRPEPPRTGPPSDDGLQDDPGSPTAVMRRLMEATLMAADYDTTRTVLADDVVVHYHTSEVPLHGPESVVDIYSNLRAGFPNMTLAPRAILGDGERAIHVSEWIGTQTARFQGIPATGRTAKVDVAARAIIRSGQVRELEMVLDASDVLCQLGVFPHLDPIPRPLRPLMALRARTMRRG